MPTVWLAVRSAEHMRVVTLAHWEGLPDVEKALFTVLGEYASEQEAEKALRPRPDSGYTGKKTRRIKIRRVSPRI